MIDYILIPIIAVIAIIVTKYSVPILLYVLKVPHTLMTILNLFFHLGIFVVIFLTLYIWPQPRTFVNGAISWVETSYTQMISFIPEEGFFPTNEPTRTPTKSASTPQTKALTPTSNKSNNAPTSLTSLQGVVVTDFGRLNLRSGPGTNYPSLSLLETGHNVIIVRRTAASDWLFVETEDKKMGWVSEQFIEVKGNLVQIPIVSNFEPPPTQIIATPKPEATATVVCNIPFGQPEFAQWQKVLGCPTGPPQVLSFGAEQAMQGGHLFWREDNDQFYVIYDRSKETGEDLMSGTWAAPSERWNDTKVCIVNQTPPAGSPPMVRGFGWWWCQFGGGPSGPLGWPLDKEYGRENIFYLQLYEHGFIWRGSDPKTYILLDDGRFFAYRP